MMSLIALAQESRLLDRPSGDEPIAMRKCVVCDRYIDRHPGVGRKPHTCGRLACKRELHAIQKWRRRNALSRKESAARFAEAPAPQAPK